MEKKIKTGPSLFELTEEMDQVLAEMEEYAEANASDLTGFPLERMEKLEGDVKAKVLKCARLYKNTRALGTMIGEERKKMAKREKAHEASGERLKAYMEQCLPQNAKFEDPQVSVAWKNNPAKVEVVVPVDKLPELFLHPPAAREPSLSKMGEAMKEYDVPVLDATGAAVLDPEGQPVTVKEMQLRWPLPTGEKKMIPNPEGGEDIEVDVIEEKVIARGVRGRSLNIR